MVIFGLILLVVCSLWFGFVYLNGPSVDPALSPEASTTNLEEKDVDSVTHVAFLERIRAYYPDVFSEPAPYSFEWRWRDPNMKTSIYPTVSRVEGEMISTSEFSFQDLAFGEQSLLFRIEQMLPIFFEQEGFVSAPENDSDHSTTGSSVAGYKHTEDGVVCLRIIEDTESEFINYRITCALF